MELVLARSSSHRKKVEAPYHQWCPWAMVLAHTSTCKSEWDIIREADEPLPCGDGHLDYEHRYQSLDGVSRVRFSGFTFLFTILIPVTISYLLTNVMLLFSFIFFVLLFVYFV
jgi:hypothetical protein